jgi:release factor glutamine methyltransferase
MAPTIREYLRDTIARLNEAHIDSPAVTARAVLSLVMGKPREWLMAHDDATLNDPLLAMCEALLSRVLAHEPLAYILGHREFYDLDLKVDPRVLIPRPETEMLVDMALQSLATHPRAGAGMMIDLIDVGTGSGAVALAVSVHAPRLRVMATDISADALDVARENARLQGVSERVCFVQSDLLAAVDTRVCVITANLPYVTVEEIEALPPEIQAHEPRLALDGGADGLMLVRRLLTQLDAHLVPGGSAFFEIGSSQGLVALEAAYAALPGWQVVLGKDLAKLDRVLQVYKPAESF